MDGHDPTPVTVRERPPETAEAPAGTAPVWGRQPAEGQPVEFHLKAPLYDNSLSSGFFGDVVLRIERGHATLSGKRSAGGRGGQFMGAGLVIGFFAISSLLVGLFGLAGLSAGSVSSDVLSTGVGVLLGAGGLGFYLYGESVATRRGREETVDFDLAGAEDRRAHFDWNIGRGLALVVTPLISLPVMLARGRRVVRLRAPVGPEGALRTLSLRACSAAEGAAVDRALRTGTPA